MSFVQLTFIPTPTPPAPPPPPTGPKIARYRLTNPDGPAYTLYHGFGVGQRIVSVDVMDDNGSKVMPDYVIYDDPNTVTIGLSSFWPFSEAFFALIIG